MGSGFGFHPANPGWGVRVCLFVCSLLLYPANPGWGVGACVLVCALCLYPAIPGSGVRCECVCLGSGFGYAPPFLAGVLGCVCLCARAACTPPILAGMLTCVRLCARSSCTQPILVGVCGVGVCAWVRVLAAPRHSWLECWGVFLCVPAPHVPRQSWLGVVVRVSRFGFGLHPTYPGWGVGVCVLCVGAPPIPRQCWLGCAVWVCVLEFGFGCAPPFLPGVLGCVCLCMCSCIPPILAVVCVVWVGRCLAPAAVLVRCVLCALPGFAAPGGRCCLAPVRVPWLWPVACLSGVPRGPAWCAAPRPVRSLSVLWLAFPSP